MTRGNTLPESTLNPSGGKNWARVSVRMPSSGNSKRRQPSAVTESMAFKWRICRGLKTAHCFGDSTATEQMPKCAQRAAGLPSSTEARIFISCADFNMVEWVNYFENGLYPLTTNGLTSNSPMSTFSRALSPKAAHRWWFGSRRRGCRARRACRSGKSSHPFAV